MQASIEFETEEELISFGGGTLNLVERKVAFLPGGDTTKNYELERELFEVFVKFTPKKRLHAEYVN